MRLPTETIKKAILYPDQELRETAVYYFGRSYSSDPSLMPLVIKAFDQFGAEAFETFTFLDDLVQTNESVAWLIQMIEQINPDADEHSSNLFTGCVAALRHADAIALKPHESTIQEMRQLDDDSKRIIANRIVVTFLSPNALWRDLTDFCKGQDQEDETSDEDYEFGCSVADALSCFPDQGATQVLDILNRGEEAGNWLGVMAVRIAGRLKLEEAIPYLVDVLSDSDSWANDDARRALVQIGTVSVVKALSSRYATADSGLRLAIAFLLEDIHSNLSVQTCLDLLDQEQDPAIRGPLIQSVLMNLSSEGIEPARQFVLSIQKCPEVLEVRHDLLVASKMMGVEFPEFEAWTEDSKTDKEFRREWYKDHPLKLLADCFEESGDGSSCADSEIDDETDISTSVKIGRNDPCPCGSGKKFKKCCLNKPKIAR